MSEPAKTKETLENWVHEAISHNYANDENGMKGTKIQVRYESLHRTIMDLILSLLPPDHPMQGMQGEKKPDPTELIEKANEALGKAVK